MPEQQERQVSVEKLIKNLREQNEQLSYDIVLKKTLIEELDEQLTYALAKIDELAPAEEITDGDPEG